MTKPGFEDIQAASQKIAGHAFRTPLIENNQLTHLAGARVFVKPENLQRTGSFKFRGAYNALATLPEKLRRKGVVACSSGNHAQGIAMAASMFDVQATIVMPDDAPATKIDRTRRSGAEVILYDRINGNRDAIALQCVTDCGGTFIHPFTNPAVIAGQGTVGLEICEDIKAAGDKLDRILVCTGGGGLTAGIALAVNNQFPNARIHPVEPEGFDDYRRSLISGKIEQNTKLSGSVCDAIISPAPGAIGFEINYRLLSEGLVVSDAQALDAVRFAFEELKLVVEPGGAVALAALLQAKRRWKGETIAVILSGGNIDAGILGAALGI